MKMPDRKVLNSEEIQEMKNWRADYGQAVKQQTVCSLTTNDKPGTLPMNMYVSEKDNSEPVNFEKMLVKESS